MVYQRAVSLFLCRKYRLRCFRNIDKSTLRRVYHAYQACVQRNLRFRCTLLSIAFDFFYLFLTTNLPHSQSTVYNFLTSSTESPVFFAMTSMGISDCLRFLAISRLSCAAPMASPSASPCLWPSLRPSSRKDA